MTDDQDTPQTPPPPPAAEEMGRAGADQLPGFEQIPEREPEGRYPR